MWLLSVAVLFDCSFGHSSTPRVAQCSDYSDCSDCLNTPAENGLDCGWCSQNVKFFNSTDGTQCMDHTSHGWVCYHLYMHDGCVAGYVCDEHEGQCILGEPGTGDEKEVCEEKCGSDKYVCDATTNTCVRGATGVSQSQCQANCPQAMSYVCNETTLTCELGPGGTWQTGCEQNCGNRTPSLLVGQWRGWNVSDKFYHWGMECELH